jgi:V/A-type H+-transporting ATPase subunit E
MNGIEKITARIASDAEAEASRISSEAASQAAEIALKWDDTARAKYAEVVSARNAERRAKASRAVAAAETEIRKSVLALKQESVSDAFRRALELIGELPEDKYVDFLARSAAKAAVTGGEELVFSAADRDRFGAKAVAAANALLAERGLPGELKLSSETRAMAGGVIVRSGDIETNCSVETAAASLRDELASQLAGTMFS